PLQPSSTDHPSPLPPFGKRCGCHLGPPQPSSGKFGPHVFRHLFLSPPRPTLSADHPSPLPPFGKRSGRYLGPPQPSPEKFGPRPSWPFFFLLPPPLSPNP